MISPTSQFDAESYLSLGTFRRTGAEVKTPVWFARDQESLFVFSAGKAGKIKRLRNSPRARVAPCGMRGDLRGAWHEVTGTLVTDPRTIARAHSAFRRKYGVTMWLADLLATVSGRRAKRAWIEIVFQ